MEDLMQNDTMQVSQSEYNNRIQKGKMSYAQKQYLSNFYRVISVSDNRAFTDEGKYSEKKEFGSVANDDRSTVNISADVVKFGTYDNKTVRISIFPRKLKQMGITNLDDMTSLLIKFDAEVKIAKEHVGKTWSKFYKEELNITLTSKEGKDAKNVIKENHIGLLYAKNFSVMPLEVLREMEAITS